jgi:hypothetical protein
MQPWAYTMQWRTTDDKLVAIYSVPKESIQMSVTYSGKLFIYSFMKIDPIDL